MPENKRTVPAGLRMVTKKAEESGGPPGPNYFFALVILVGLAALAGLAATAAVAAAFRLW